MEGQWRSPGRGRHSVECEALLGSVPGGAQCCIDVLSQEELEQMVQDGDFYVEDVDATCLRVRGDTAHAAHNGGTHGTGHHEEDSGEPLDSDEDKEDGCSEEATDDDYESEDDLYSAEEEDDHGEPDFLAHSEFFTCESLVQVEDLKPAEVIARIEAHSIVFLNCLASGNLYQPSLVKRARDNRVIVDSKIRLGMEVTHKSFHTHPQSYYRLWKVLEFLHNILKCNKRVTQREMYYCMIDSFANQRELNHTIQEVVALLNCPRISLAITATERGLILGQVSWQEKGLIIDCRRVGCSGRLISSNLADIRDIRSEARFIIVVEKDAVFQRLAEDKVYDTLPSILITAKGYPDIATRALLKRLQEELHLPIVGLFDWNPGGMGVYITYRYGSMKTGLESHNYAVDIKWLGLCWADIKQLRIPRRCLQEMNERDARSVQTIEEFACFKDNPRCSNELRIMKKKSVKAEIQVLNHLGPSYLSEYVIRKAIRREF